ncbi:MAG: hypothetical protein KDC53_02870 [Saprospiraceae bacterium]|nr:hypothetical protein [Saprospiraceae bacterium]
MSNYFEIIFNTITEARCSVRRQYCKDFQSKTIQVEILRSKKVGNYGDLPEGKRKPCQLIWLGFLLLWLAACVKNDELPGIELESSSPFLAFPLANVNISSNELIEELEGDTRIQLNSEGLYTAFFTSDSIVKTKDELFPKIDINLPLPIIDSVVVLPLSLISDFALKKGVLKGDAITFTFNSLEEEDIRVTIRLPQLKKEGKEFTAEFVIAFDGSPPSTFITPAFGLEGYEVDFSSGNLSMIYDARNVDGQRIVLPLSFAQIGALDFSYLEGSIAQTSIPSGLQRIDVAIQDSLVEGTYTFQNPKIHFDVANSFGVPIGINVKNVYVVGADMVPQALQSTLFDNLIILDYPGFSEIGDVVNSRITFDKSNSNLLAITHNDIVAIDYDLDIIINPESSGNSDFFITDSSRAILSAEVELSFDAVVEEISISKAIPTDFSSLDSVIYFRLKAIVDNGLPLSFDPILYLKDTIGGMELILKEEAGRKIESAPTDELGNQIGTATSVLYFEGDEQDVVTIRNMNLLETTFVIKSPLEGSIPTKISPELRLDLRLGVEVKLH